MTNQPEDQPGSQAARTEVNYDHFTDTALGKTKWKSGLAILAGLVAVTLISAVIIYLTYLPKVRVEKLVETAKKAMNAGELRDALFQLNKAADLAPDNPTVLYQRAEVLFRMNRDSEAVADCRQCIQLNHKPRRVYSVLSYALLNTGNYVAAIEATKQELRLSKAGVVQARAENRLAYTYALANRELQTALDLSNKSIKMIIKHGASDLPAYLDTRGYIYFRMGQNELALADMNRAIPRLEQYLAQYANLRLPSRYKTQVEQTERSLAVFFYHRSLIYDQMKKPLKAQLDRDRIEELGHKPGDKLY